MTIDKEKLDDSTNIVYIFREIFMYNFFFQFDSKRTISFNTTLNQRKCFLTVNLNSLMSNGFQNLEAAHHQTTSLFETVNGELSEIYLVSLMRQKQKNNFTHYKYSVELKDFARYFTTDGRQQVGQTSPA